MSSKVETYSPTKATGYTVDQFVEYERQLYKCKKNTPKPAGAFDDQYWNLIGYLLDSSGILNYNSEEVEMEYIDPDSMATLAELQSEVTDLQNKINIVSGAVTTEAQNRANGDTAVLNKFKYVTALPSSPDSTTFYFIKE